MGVGRAAPPARSNRLPTAEGLEEQHQQVRVRARQRVGVVCLLVRDVAGAGFGAKVSSVTCSPVGDRDVAGRLLHEGRLLQETEEGRDTYVSTMSKAILLVVLRLKGV